jgi:hypothetical protein
VDRPSVEQWFCARQHGQWRSMPPLGGPFARPPPAHTSVGLAVAAAVSVAHCNVWPTGHAGAADALAAAAVVGRATCVTPPARFPLPISLAVRLPRRCL